MLNKFIVNIEIKDYVIRHSQIDIASGEVVRIGEQFVPNGIIDQGVIEEQAEFIKILKTCVKKWKLKRKKVRLTMPDSLVIIRRQKVPKEVKVEDFNRFVKFSLGETIHLPFETPIFDTVLVEEGDEKGHEASIISTDEQIAKQYRDCFREAGMKLTAVDISPLNYYRLLYKHKKVNEQDHLLLIQYNANHVVFTAFKNSCPVLLQHFNLLSSDEEFITPFGPTLTKEDFNIKDVLSEFEEINTEIERIERFYQFSMNEEQQSFTKIAVVGDHPHLEEITYKIEQSYDIPIIQLDEREVKGPKGIQVEQKYYNVYGLALKEGL
ncbi:type IV pilus biogenesis protein PilM [Bacillaceae bacterium W0354]